MIALVFVVFGLFASLFTFSKWALSFTAPFFLIGSRMALAGILLMLHQFIFNRKMFTFNKQMIISLFLLGFVGIYISNISEIWAMQYMSSAKACLMYSLSPFVAALVAAVVLKERFSLKKLLGICIGFIGLLPIVYSKIEGDVSATTGWWLSGSEGMMIVAVFASVYGWILLKKNITTYALSPIMANGVSMLIGGVLALIHSYVAGEWPPIKANYGLSFMECTLWMILISNILAYNLYGYLLTKYSATFLALAGLITPLFASFFGWYFLGEQITWHFYVSGALFFLGLLIFYQEEIRR